MIPLTTMTLPNLFAMAGMLVKPIEYFIDSTIRDKVTPIAGSVIYCDLWLAVEHSGIYVADGMISNIEVTDLAESTVRYSNPQNFTQKSILGKCIYVSCDNHGSVGNHNVARGADSHIGDKAFYGLVFNNCHDFSTKCVNYADGEKKISIMDRFAPDGGGTLEPTLRRLKATAKKKLGAVKWRLWDWQQDNSDDAKTPEPDWQAINEQCKNQPLNSEVMIQLRAELAELQAYQEELADESIPDAIRQQLQCLTHTLSDISEKYEKAKPFLTACPGSDFSFNQLQACNEDFTALANQLKNNHQIKELVRKMGRDYISEEKKRTNRIPQASKSEVYGTHHSDDLMRLLPSELLNLEDDTLEHLFYARLLEKNLLTYELQGTELVNGEQIETVKKRTGPVVACLDTSSSMQGEALLKAKALLLAIANILKQEERSLYVLLFGSTGELREFSMSNATDIPGLLHFLAQGFNGGTDFETPLQRAFQLIASTPEYIKADVLMLSDGDCSISDEFAQQVQKSKAALDCSIYSVLCAGGRVQDKFSDEVVVL